MEILNLLKIHTQNCLERSCLTVQKARTGKKLKVKLKTVFTFLMATKETLTWVDGTMVTIWISAHQQKTIQTNKSKILRKNWQKPKNLSAWIIFNTDNVKSEISLLLYNNATIDTAINTGTVGPDKAIPKNWMET